MNLEKYNQLKSNPAVLKINHTNTIFFKTKNKKHYVIFLYCYSGLPNGLNIDFRKKLHLESFPIEFSENIPQHPEEIVDEQLIMVNVDEPNYAQTYKLTVLNDINEINIILEDKPELAANYIPKRELKGFNIKLK